MERLLVFSADGHATARMPDYRPYIPESHREEFDAFCKVYAARGTGKNFEPKSLKVRLDEDVLDEWSQDFWDVGRLDGYWDMDRRLKEMEREGIAGEVLFPDFGLPFELNGSRFIQATEHDKPLTPEQVAIRNRAYNRWLADYCSQQPKRFAGMALVDFSDVDEAIQEIRWARDAGLKGVLLPEFKAEEPVYHSKFDPIWAVLCELDMPANAHSGVSSTVSRLPDFAYPPNATCAYPIFVPVFMYFCRQLLNQMVWGGVFERHPDLKAVYTEMQSDWVLGQLAQMDHTYKNSFLKRESHDALSIPPSEYFQRQCYVGASLFSRAEVAARHDFGIDKLQLGADYPHHEGTTLLGLSEYLSETLGAANVPLSEARVMLGESAASLWDMDIEALRSIADTIGVEADKALSPPTTERTIRGDILRPLAGGGGAGP